MRKTLFIALALACLLLPAEAKKKVRVHTIGDSTMADYAENTTRTRGWGEMFQEFFTDDVEVMNYARGGRSTRSFNQRRPVGQGEGQHRKRRLCADTVCP